MSTAAAITAPVSPASQPATTAATVAAPATTPTPAAAPVTANTGAAPATQNWTDGFNDDTKGWVQGKGYKGAEDLANAYRSLEKLHGVPQDRLLKLPESFYDEKGALTADGRAIRERLGAPKDVAGYGVEMPKEGGDPKRLENFLSNALAMGIPKADVQKLVAIDAQYAASVQNGGKEAAAAKFRDESAALTTEWGAAFESNKNIAADAARKMGWDAKKIDALASVMGHADTMKTLLQMGKSFGEASYIGGKAAAGPMEPATAKSRIAELRADKDFGSRLMAGEMEAKATWQRLHEQAYQGTVNL